MKLKLIEIIIILLTLFAINSNSLEIHSKSNAFNVESRDSSTVPIVFYHGMGDTSQGSIYGIQEFLEKHLIGVYVNSIRMGTNAEEDLMDGFFMNLNDQVMAACHQIKNDKRLANGYNALGFSQGGQILRAIAQRCPEPPILNLISFGGQHQGVYGLPRCPGSNKTICDLVRKLINYGAYEDFVQQHLVQAEVGLSFIDIYYLNLI